MSATAGFPCNYVNGLGAGMAVGHASSATAGPALMQTANVPEWRKNRRTRPTGSNGESVSVKTPELLISTAREIRPSPERPALR